MTSNNNPSIIKIQKALVNSQKNQICQIFKKKAVNVKVTVVWQIIIIITTVKMMKMMKEIIIAQVRVNMKKKKKNKIRTCKKKN